MGPPAPMCVVKKTLFSTSAPSLANTSRAPAKYGVIASPSNRYISSSIMGDRFAVSCRKPATKIFMFVPLSIYGFFPKLDLAISISYIPLSHDND